MIPYVPWLGDVYSIEVVKNWVRKRTFDEYGTPTGYNALIFVSLIQLVIPTNCYFVYTNIYNVIKTSQKAAAEIIKTSKSKTPSLYEAFNQIPSSDNRKMASDAMWRECFSKIATNVQ